MKKMFRKYSALMAVLFLGVPARSQGVSASEKNKMKTALGDLFQSLSWGENVDSQVVVRRDQLEEVLGIELTEEKYNEVQSLIDQMKDSGVMIKEVSPEEMVLSTQEYAC